MTFQVRVRSEARADLEDAALWYEMQRSGLGSEFIDEVERTFDRVASDPSAYRILHRETRRAVLQRFPFGVFYRIQERTIIVVAVMHSSRNPRKWKRRT